MADLDEYAMAKLAREMAMAIRNYKDIYKDFGLNEETFYEVSKHPFYLRAKEQFALEWNSALSTNDRVKLISAAYIEEALPTLGRRMLTETEPLSNVTDVAKFFAKNAGLGEPKTMGNSAERFVITINIGDDSRTYDKSLNPDSKEIDLVAVKEKALKVVTEQSNGKANNGGPKEDPFDFVCTTGEGDGAEW